MTSPTPTEKAEEKIAYLAERVMGWYESKGNRSVLWWRKDGHKMALKSTPYSMVDDDEQPMVEWNPLTDWNHWREVEEKVMEDHKLRESFLENFVTCDDDDLFGMASIEEFVNADLPARVDALISAHRTLCQK